MHGRTSSGRIRTGALATQLCAIMITGLLSGCDKGTDGQANPDTNDNLATDGSNLPHNRESQTVDIAGFQVTLSPKGVELRREGNVYWSQTGTGLKIQSQTLKGSGTITPGADITGDGLANLIVRETIGAGIRFTVLSLTEEVDVIAQIDAPASAGFRDFDGDGVLEMITRDQTWADLLGEDAPAIVLRWTGSGFAASAKDLTRPEPRLEQLEPKIEQIVLAETWATTGPPIELYREALDLAYSGHEDLALRFIRFAWPEGQAGRDAFVAQFKAKLAASPHFTQMSDEFASAGGG